ncbi:hypothetical protein OG241_09255 [Streptomyces sp. NBC_01390]|uniref:hypothetical protein n=1 Tax=unclassified Streptomyces TaxID=2593676 RepID=UPI0032434917
MTKTVMERVLKVPNSFRRLDSTSVDAQRIHGISPDLLDILLDLGLPHKGASEAARFDRLDLENISVALRLPSKHWLAMRMWPRHLTRPRTEEESVCKIHVSWRCPELGHEGVCSFSASPQLQTVSGDCARDIPDAGSLEIEVPLEDDEYVFGDPFHVVADAARTLTYHRISPELARDDGFLTETLLADCRSATRHLIRIADSTGFEARPASGYFVGTPFPTVHNWLELKQEERWVAADPFFLTTLRRWGLVDEEKWPTNSSPRKIFWRLGSSDSMPAPLVLHRGVRPALTSLMRVSRTRHPG